MISFIYCCILENHRIVYQKNSHLFCSCVCILGKVWEECLSIILELKDLSKWLTHIHGHLVAAICWNSIYIASRNSCTQPLHEVSVFSRASIPKDHGGWTWHFWVCWGYHTEPLCFKRRELDPKIGHSVKRTHETEILLWPPLKTAGVLTITPHSKIYHWHFSLIENNQTFVSFKEFDQLLNHMAGNIFCHLFLHLWVACFILMPRNGMMGSLSVLLVWITTE